MHRAKCIKHLKDHVIKTPSTRQEKRNRPDGNATLG